MLDTPSHYRPTNLPKQILELAGKRLSNINKDFTNKETIILQKSLVLMNTNQIYCWKVKFYIII